MADYSKAILFFNTKAGHSKPEIQKDIISSHFKAHDIDLKIIDVPKPQEEINAFIEKGINRGVEIFIAAGGDGTVSFVSSALVGKQFSLGILPIGTGNLVALELGIPLKLEKALELITAQDRQTLKIDTFQLGKQHFVSNISIGVSPQVIQHTRDQEKQRFGVFAYLISFIQQILGIQLHQVNIEYDHQKTTTMASEVLITNIKIAGLDPLIWSEEILMNDGTMDLLVFRAANFTDILSLLISVFAKKSNLNPVVKFLKVKEYCRIASTNPMQIQADGDLIGETPVEITICPQSLKVIIGEKCSQPINHKVKE